MPAPFHLAFPVADLAATERFYCDVLGARVGRASERWVDLDLYGHQLSAHLADTSAAAAAGDVDGDRVPLPHFGVVLTRAEWDALVARVRAAGVPFAIEPRVRFAGQPGEQATFFVRDPSGNALEFKAMASAEGLFAG